MFIFSADIITRIMQINLKKRDVSSSYKSCKNDTFSRKIVVAKNFKLWNCCRALKPPWAFSKVGRYVITKKDQRKNPQNCDKYCYSSFQATIFSHRQNSHRQSSAWTVKIETYFGQKSCHCRESCQNALKCF